MKTFIRHLSYIVVLLFETTTICWSQSISQNKIISEQVKYINIDSTRNSNPNRKGKAGGWFGLDFTDANSDGLIDIVSGAWLYKNPGGNMEGVWEKVILNDSLDAILSLDVDNDEFADVIAIRCNEQYWLEAKDISGNAWEKHLIGKLPICDHKMGSQGYIKCDLNKDKKNELVITGEGIYSLSIPENPETELWPYTEIQEKTSNGEGLVAGDFDGDGDLDIASALIDEKEGHAIYWWENLDGSGKKWKKWFIGRTIHDADRFAVGDFNEDGKPDIAIFEERYPGLEKDANLYWFENNIREEWTRHQLFTAYTLNNLDAGDFDMDGKTDLITAEHLGPDLRLLFIRNLGNTKFEDIVLDTGKENHLGTILKDLDNDGDLDIIGIAWFNYKNVHLWRNDIIQKSDKDKTGFFIPIEIESSGNDKSLQILETKIELPEETNGLFFDKDYFLMEELNSEGKIINNTVPFQLDDMGKKVRDNLFLTWEIKQNSRQKKRHFRLVYSPGIDKRKFDNLNKVQIDSVSDYMGQPSYIIKNNTATLYYHKEGGGFASLIDTMGNDWISYNQSEGSGGSFRGIPNIRPAGFHPGKSINEKISTSVVNHGPLKVTIQSKRVDDSWVIQWDVYPDKMKMTLDGKSQEPFWILYEGTPGGKLEPNKDRWFRSDGEKGVAAEDWRLDLPYPEWVAFIEEKNEIALFLLNQNDDDCLDQYWPMEENMTVFGFGRGKNPNQRTVATMKKLPAVMTMALVHANKVSQFRDIASDWIQPTQIKVGRIVMDDNK